MQKFLLRDPKLGSSFGFSVSHTTRKPRSGEVDGVHYHFVNEAEMQKLMTTGCGGSGGGNDDSSPKQPPQSPFFIETANVHSNWYGTSFAAVQSVQNQGLICLLDIDIQGVRSINRSSLHTHSFFMTPPLSQLEERLRGRGSETEDSLRTRISNAEREIDAAMAAGDELFDAVIVADSTAEVYEELKPHLYRWYADVDGDDDV